MAYKQKGCTPITAKIQKTTKGGVTNPLLKAMGVPMKKNPSMAKKNIDSTTLASGDKPANSNDKNRAQMKVNAANRKAGKAVSYDAAYADADKSKYKTKEEFITAAKAYNKKKYNTTNPTADAKKAGKTKAQLATDVKNNRSKSRPKVEKVSNIETTEKISEIKTAPKTKKEVRVENRTNRKAARKENRANRKATREENKANRKAARNGSPAKQTMQQQNRVDRKAARKAKSEVRADRRVASKEVTKTLAKPKESGKSPAKNYKKGYYGK
jgi:hypothetical protein